VEADASIAGPSADSSQQEETSAAADRSYTVSGPHVPESVNVAESSKQKETTSATNYAGNLGVLEVSRGREVTEHRTFRIDYETRRLLPTVKEDVRLKKMQHKSQTVVQKRQINNPQEFQKVQGGLATSGKDSEWQPSPLSTLMKATTTLSDKNVRLLQALREDMTFQNQGMIEEYCGIKESNGSRFAGDECITTSGNKRS
jgi:hypothetical protein